MEAEFLRGLRQHQSRLRHDERLIRILVRAIAFEGIASIDNLAIQISSLAGCSAELLEAIVMGLKIIICDAPIL